MLKLRATGLTLITVLPSLLCWSTPKVLRTSFWSLSRSIQARGDAQKPRTRPCGYSSELSATKDALEVPDAPAAGRRGKKQKRSAESLEEFKALRSAGVPVYDLEVIGDSYAQLESRTDTHPVLAALQRRRAAGTKPNEHKDGLKVGLAIEGGGMRGCVSAGMIASIVALGYMDGFDAVYGSSAGSLIGAYAICGQEGMPRLGCSVYYDALTGRGAHFIDPRYLGRAMGLGWLATPFTRASGLRDLLTDRMGQPVLKLDYLLQNVVEEQVPLDWDRFWERQAKQPLHVIASGVGTGGSVCLSAKGGHFSTLRELTTCMRASMLLPGITGPMVQLPMVDEPLVDSQLYEPIPFRTALADGCTHVLVLRSRPDGLCVIGKPKVTERLIMRRYFKRKYRMLEPYAYMKRGGHKEVYAADVLRLNAEAAQTEESGPPFLMPISLPTGEAEIARLERTREGIFGGVRQGFEAGFTLLRGSTVPNCELARKTALEAAAAVFPDDILEHPKDPVVLDVLAKRAEANKQSAAAVVEAAVTAAAAAA